MENARYFYIGDEEDTFTWKIARIDEQIRRLSMQNWQLQRGKRPTSVTDHVRPGSADDGSSAGTACDDAPRVRTPPRRRQRDLRAPPARSPLRRFPNPYTRASSSSSSSSPATPRNPAGGRASWGAGDLGEARGGATPENAPCPSCCSSPPRMPSRRCPLRSLDGPGGCGAPSRTPCKLEANPSRHSAPRALNLPSCASLPTHVRAADARRQLRGAGGFAPGTPGRWDDAAPCEPEVEGLVERAAGEYESCTGSDCDVRWGLHTPCWGAGVGVDDCSNHNEHAESGDNDDNEAHEWPTWRCWSALDPAADLRGMLPEGALSDEDWELLGDVAYDDPESQLQQVEALRAELSDRNREIERLRHSEAEIRHRVADEMHMVREQISETRMHQESLACELMEAERQQQQEEEDLQVAVDALAALPPGWPLRDLLSLPPEACDEAERASLHDAVHALAGLARHLRPLPEGMEGLAPDWMSQRGF